MHPRLSLLLLSLVFSQGSPAISQDSYSPSPENLKARAWFQEARYGLFIHWGVYSVAGDGEWVMQNKRITISGETNWRHRGKNNEPYVQEHTDLIESIRAGKPYNELKNVTESTLTAIMGRISAYTGKAVSWEEALASSETLVPTALAFGPLPVPPVARPGQVT